MAVSSTSSMTIASAKTWSVGGEGNDFGDIMVREEFYQNAGYQVIKARFVCSVPAVAEVKCHRVLSLENERS
jgi:hypothetical protein